MKHPLAVALLVASLFIPVFAPAGRAQESGGEPPLPDTANGLRLSAEIIGDKKKFRRPDTFSIKVRLKNVGRSPITLYKHMGWGWSSSFSMGISDGRGRGIGSLFIDDALHYPPFPEEDFVTIKPGEVIERRTWVSLKRYEIREPGMYSVTVWYQSPVPREFAPEGMKIRAMEDGRLESKPVRFEIVE